MSGDTLAIKKNRPVTALVEATLTRPSDTTTYTAGDVVANSTSAPVVITFSNMAREAGLGGIIQGACCINNVAQTLKPDLELYLFDQSPTIQNDNAAWAPTDAHMKYCLGMIRFAPGNFNVGSGNGIIRAEPPSLSFKCFTGVKALYGILVVRNAYIPTSAEEFFFRLHVIQD